MNILLQFIFFSQNCINYSFSCVFRIINILSKKDHLYFRSEKKKYMPFNKKKLSFHRKSEFFYDFLLIPLLSSKNKQKTLNITTIYIFFLKRNNKLRVFFNVFRSINGILNKTPFYKYNICNLNQKENSA